MFSLVHLSDPHLGPLPHLRLRELASKRMLGYVNWRRNRGGGLGPESLQALVEDIQASEPDHVAVTGDLINLGLKAEILAARRWLDDLGDPAKVSVVPGNHDAYLPGAIAEFETAWGPYMAGDEAEEGALAFPFVRRRDDIAIVGVSTALATAPLMATGRIRVKQASHLSERLAALGKEGLFRVVLIHHPPIKGSTRWHKRLIGAGYFREAIRRSGAELILHGHNHRTSYGTLPGPGGRRVPVIGVGCASRRARENRPGGSYLRFDIERCAAGFTCDVTERGVTPETTVETVAERRLMIDGAQAGGTVIHA